MLKLIKRNYLWPGIKGDIKKYIKECIKCQQDKIQYMKKAGELHPLEIPKGLQQEININIIGLLPRSNRKDAIMVIVDQFTKIIKLKATMTAVSFEKIAKIYQDEIWKIDGVPQKILSDRELQFAS